jgi:hypothetical protein
VITVESAGQATLRWHASEAVLDGRTLRIKGSTRLKRDDGAWRLDATRLLDVEQRSSTGAPAGQTLPQTQLQTQAQAPWTVAEEQRRDDGAGETLH